MLIEQGRVEGMLQVTYCGERLDSVHAKAFQQHLATIIAKGERRILLDLARVDFVDSAGLGVLVGLAKLTAPDGTFELMGLQGRVAHLLTLTRMDEVLTIRDMA